MNYESVRESLSQQEDPNGQLVLIRGSDKLHGEFSTYAYIPSPLPHSVNLTTETWTRVNAASAAVARLDQATKGLHDPQLLIYPALFREALDTSALEGTYGQLSELLEVDLPGNQQSTRETLEINAYLEAARSAFSTIRDRQISLSMLCEIQSEIFKTADKPPRDIGQVRTHQVWIGGEGRPIAEARFVPAPGDDRLRAGLENLVDWIGSESHLPSVVRVAMSHYQFETLHPFGDGNGRVGRLMVILQLLREHAIDVPAITISPWLLRNRAEYQDQMLHLSMSGDWNPWVSFFCRALEEQSLALVDGARRLDQWYLNALELINEHGWSGRIESVLKGLAVWPTLTVRSTATKYEITPAAATNIIKHLCDIGIIAETTGKSHGRIFSAQGVVNIVTSI